MEAFKKASFFDPYTLRNSHKQSQKVKINKNTRNFCEKERLNLTEYECRMIASNEENVQQ